MERHRVVVENYFDCIDTEVKAYLLGFITADGSIDDSRNTKVLRVHISQEDKYVIDILESEIGSTIKTYYYDKCNSVEYRVSSNRLCEALMKYGIIPRKTGKEVLAFDILSDEMCRHYVRGLIDGDGWISNTRYEHGVRKAIGFCGSKTACYQLSEFLNSQIGTYKVKPSKVKGKNNYKINYLGFRDTEEIIKYLYKGSTVYLDRKYKAAMKKVIGGKKRGIPKWR